MVTRTKIGTMMSTTRMATLQPVLDKAIDLGSGCFLDCATRRRLSCLFACLPAFDGGDSKGMGRGRRGWITSPLHFCRALL